MKLNDTRGVENFSIPGLFKIIKIWLNYWPVYIGIPLGLIFAAINAHCESNQNLWIVIPLTIGIIIVGFISAADGSFDEGFTVIKGIFTLIMVSIVIAEIPLFLTKNEIKIYQVTEFHRITKNLDKDGKPVDDVKLDFQFFNKKDNLLILRRTYDNTKPDGVEFLKKLYSGITTIIVKTEYIPFLKYKKNYTFLRKGENNDSK